MLAQHPLLCIISSGLRSICMALVISACGSNQENLHVPLQDRESRETLRLATFNVAMGRSHEGELTQALQQQSDTRLQALAAIIQEVRPDILVLNEFDYDPAVDAPRLLRGNYLGRSQHGQAAIDYPYYYRAGVNTGLESGLDLNGNGVLGEPEDAWGYGTFPGQYGMLVLSRFPVDPVRSRTFQKFAWASLPAARVPLNPDATVYYPDEIWHQLRLSSKNNWDVAIDVEGRPLHLLVFHPTPPVFDGAENRNGLRNFDEIRFWVEYLAPQTATYLVDDQGRGGGLKLEQPFVIAGDFNADPLDGDSMPGAVAQLLDHPRINRRCIPFSNGAREATRLQGGKNRQHRGNPASDTSDFNDELTGNLRLDYLLPSAELNVSGCGVFWPAVGQAGHELIGFSDHRLVWLDIEW